MTLIRTRRRSASLSLAAVLSIAFILSCAATARAQVVSDPRVAEFDPSPDHWAVLDSGQPAVLRYELRIYMVGASAPFTKVDMGKPSPDADGKIRYNLASGVAGWPLPGGEYEARVSAVGSEGAALSAPSNRFTFRSPSPCTVSLSATTGRVPASGGSYAVDVTTAEGCSWSSSTALPWVTMWTASGTGSATAAFEVKANASSSSRSGTITVGGKVLTLTQDGVPAPVPAGTALRGAQLKAGASVPGTQVINDAAVVADFDAAFDSVQQQYLVVWHTWNADIKGLLLNAQGQALGNAFLIDTSALAPRAAYSPTSQTYLVTYTKGKTRLARTVTPTADAATLGTVWSLGSMHWVAGHGNPGGTAWLPSSNTFLTTWWDGARTILVRAVGPGGPTGTATALTATDIQEMPDITCGPTACLVVGRTWDQLIWGRWLNLAGAATSARFTLEQGTRVRDWARVAYSETAAAFTVAWSRAGIPQTTMLPAGATTVGTIQPVVAGRVGAQLDLAFNSGLNRFGVAAQGNAADIWVQGLDSAGTPWTDPAAAASEVATTDGRPVIVPNPLASQFLVIYRPTLQTLRTRLVGGNASSTFGLTVSTTGAGSGALMSSPAGINCGSDCSDNYASGIVVSLTATPVDGSTFAGWSGDADCTDGSVTMTAARTCTAIFSTAGGGPAASAPIVPGTQVINDAAVVADFDAAFDSVQQQYLVVWHTWNADIKGLLLNAQGQALGSAFLIDTSALAPRAAYSPTSQTYLVTYTKGKTRLARTVTPTADAATLGTDWALGAMHWVAGHGNPGGTAWVPSSNTFLTTWWDGSRTILVRAVGPGGPTGTATTLAGTDAQELPDITCGPTACLVVGRTWDQLIWGRWLNLSGTPTSARFTIEQGTSTARDGVRVAYSETAGAFTVAWTRDGIPQTTTLAPGATSAVTIQPVVAGRVGMQLDLAFNSALNVFGVAAQGNASDIWVQGLDSAGTPWTDPAAAASEVATTDGRPVIVPNPLASQFLVIYRHTLQTLRTRVFQWGF